MALTIATLTVDCADPARLARWWSEALGWRLREHSTDEVEVEPPEGEPTSPLLFLRVPDDKRVKNRLHLDLRPDDQAAEVSRLEAMGARRIDIGQIGAPDVTWVVLADPEGNEFCVLRALRPGEQ